MCSFNCEQYIDRAIYSVLNQTFKNFKLIILDDASSDSTWVRINDIKDSRISKFRNSENIGYLRSTNYLLKLCTTKYIAFQDADDWSCNTRFEEQFTLLEKSNKYKLCGSNCVKVYSNWQETISYPRTHTEITTALDRGKVSLFCGASIMFKREIMDTTGTYSSIYNRRGAEDIDWYLRAVEKHKCFNISKPLYYYRQHESSISREIANHDKRYSSTDIAYLAHLLRSNGKPIDHDILNTMLGLSKTPSEKYSIRSFLSKIVSNAAINNYVHSELIEQLRAGGYKTSLTKIKFISVCIKILHMLLRLLPNSLKQALVAFARQRRSKWIQMDYYRLLKK